MIQTSNKRTIRLTESELKEFIEKHITEALEDEGIWNQIKQGAKSFVGNGYRGVDKQGNPTGYRNTVADRQARGENTANVLNGTTPMNLKQRWNAAKTGFQQQGIVDNMDSVLKTLNDLISSGKIDPNATVSELVRQGGKFGKNLDTIKRTANSKISQANNDIYKGMNTGVMGSGRTGTV